MAQIREKATTDVEMLNWNLWNNPDSGQHSPVDRSRAASRLLSLGQWPGSQKIGSPTPLRARVSLLGSAGLSLAGPSLVYGLLALSIMLPMLWPGFILTLDMAFTPELRMPEQISSSYLFHAALHYLNVVLPADVVQKIMLFGILLMSGLGAYLLVRFIQTSKNKPGEFAVWGAYLAGAFYMANPFTYSRFMAGQYAVLLGYALLPFFARAILRFLAVPTLGRSFAASGWAIAIGIVSVHTLGLAAILAGVSFIFYAWQRRQNREVMAATVIYGIIGLTTFIIASGYWLFPLLNGSSNQGQAVAQFNPSDEMAFATVGGDLVGKLGNILQLQGFWAEGQGLYLLPQDQLPGWALAILAFWILVGAGLHWLWREHSTMAVMFAGAGLAAIILAITGVGDFSALAGFREPHKFVGLLALAYAVFAGVGAANILAWAKGRGEVLLALAGVPILVLPILLTPTMFWGFSGQLSPRHYPADWFGINQKLNQDESNFRVLSLPWHLYMRYRFSGRVIVNPSDKFFDKPTVTSNELEFKNASPTFPDEDKERLSDQILPPAPNNPRFGEELAELGIKYVLLAKTFDYQDYDYLDKHPDLKLISETPNLKLYRNLSYGQ